VVGQVTAKLGNSQAEIPSESSMKLYISITLKEDDLEVVINELLGHFIVGDANKKITLL
jgi:hypothetical protein